MNIQSKLPDVGTTIFTKMSALAAKHGAINLSQGFPDFDVDPELIQLVNTYMKDGYNQYAPMQGVHELRIKLAEKANRLYGAIVNPDTDITITAGATEALYAAITAVVRPGDEAVIIEPAFDTYMPAIVLNGGVPIYVGMTFPDYKINWDGVGNAITAKTRLIILNSPHNPTGMVISDQDLSALNRIVMDKDIFIISDEVYEHIIFDTQPHLSLLGHSPLSKRCFVISSFGKTYHTTGWKTGYCIAPPALTEEFRKVHQFLTFAVNTPIQHAYAEIMENQSYYDELKKFYQEKRDRFLSLMAPSKFKALPCSGTYFQMMDYSNISNTPDVAFAEEMTVEHGVAAIPPSVFYHNGKDNRVLRFCFAKKDKTLKEAADILCRI